MKYLALILIFFITIVFSEDSYCQKPENLEQCNEYLGKTLKKKDIKYIKSLNENELSELHMALGLHIRNFWLREEGFDKLNAYFHELGLRHYDDVSSLIIKNYWYYLNDKKFDLDSVIAQYEEYYRKAAIYQKESKEKQQRVENLLNSSLKKLNIIQKEVPIIEIPQRELHVFCNEFIPFKNGIIINSLTTYPDNPDVGINYNYFFLNLSTKKIQKIICNQLDLIESIIVDDNQLYISGKKKNKNIILRSSNGVYKTIQTPNNDSINSWIKLGFYSNELIALQTDGVYTWNDSLWQHYYEFSLDSFNQKNGIIGAKSIIPTENIRIVNDKLYFVQEIVQERRCNLLELDLVNKSIVEFFYKVGLCDNSLKTILTYSVDTLNNIYVVGSNMYLKSSSEKIETFILNNKVKSVSNSDYVIRPRIVINKVDTQLIIAENGIFALSNSNISPMLLFNNQDKRFNYYSSKFRPRAYLEISENKFLLGGMYGGIVLIDLINFETEWLDESKIENSIEISEL